MPRGHYVQLADADRCYVVDEFKAGKTSAEIARGLGARVPGRTFQQNRNLVYQLLYRNGVSLRGAPNEMKRGAKRRISQEDIVAAYRSGLRTPEIARRFGCGATWIHEVLTRYGVINRQKGRHYTSEGYILVKVPNGGPTTDYVREHRRVMEQHLGRPLERHETIHHINGDRTDNRIENLQLHSGRHGKGVARRCRACGSFDIETVPIEGHKDVR